MNPLMIFVAALLVIGLAACAEEGSYWDTNTKQMGSDKVGRLETVGIDMRVYEFTPQTSPNIQCVFVGAAEKGGLQCWPKSLAKLMTIPEVE